MGVIDRILLTLYTLALATLSAITFLMAWGWLVPLNYINSTLQNPNGRWGIGVTAAIIFVLSIRWIYYGFRPRGGMQTIVHQTELGEVRISLGAIENLIRKVSKQVDGVRDIRVVVYNSPPGISVKLRGTVSPDISIPEVSHDLQDTIKDYVRRVVGIEVSSIRLAVENISNESKK